MPVISPSDVAIALVIAVVLVFVARRSRAAVSLADPLATAGDEGTTGSYDPPPDADPDIELGRQTVTLREKAFGPEHPDVAAACHILGAMYLDRGRFADAEPLLQRALSIRTSVFGPGHREVVLTTVDVAAVYAAQGRYADAEHLTRRLLALAQGPSGRDRPDVAAALSQLGALQRVRSRSPEVAPPIETVLGSDVDRAASQRGVAPLRDRDAGHPNAEPDFGEESSPVVVAPSPRIEAGEVPDRPDVATILAELAALRLAQADPKTAEELYRRALAGLEASGATGLPALCGVLHELGRIAYATGKTAEAKRLWKRALAAAVWATPDHPDGGRVLADLARLELDQGDAKAAESLYRRALASLDGAAATDAPELRTVLRELGRLSRDRGDYVEAEGLLEQAVAASERALGPDHPEVARIREDLGWVRFSRRSLRAP